MLFSEKKKVHKSTNAKNLACKSKSNCMQKVFGRKEFEGRQKSVETAILCDVYFNRYLTFVYF